MLFTRCPECTTTFRVSDEALKKANGRVRCGRCASVFNAVVEQVGNSAGATAEPPTPTPPPPSAPLEPLEPPAPPSAEVVPAPRPLAAQEPPAAETRPQYALGEETPLANAPPPAPPPADTRDPGAASIGASSVADLIAEAERASEATDAPTATPEPVATNEPMQISPEQVDDVLTETTNTPLFAVEPTWTPLATPKAAASRWWKASAVLALILLAVQIANHYRSALASDPVFGPWTQRAYAFVGITVAPHWDVRQYEVLDWVATAEPNARGVGSLKISARIQNHGPQRQPYPEVQLRLKDRWEKAVGSRVFTPMEYLSRDAPHAALMAAGETARAEIELVDPGPDAYGFEIDVCIEVEAKRLTCRGDKVFL
jgi:predicted Zn finger-like uncharacterized protein